MKKKLLQNRYSSSSSSDDEIISCPSQCSSFSRIKRKRIENISNDNEKINKKEQIREHCHIRNNNSTLMSLPNELFGFLLVYLSSCDIVQSLNGINKRLNSLIYQFTHQIDVSTKENEWVFEHLSTIQSLATKLKCNHAQLQILFPTATATTTIHDQYPHLKSMIWNYQCDHNDCQCTCMSYINLIKTKVLSLNLNLNFSYNKTINKKIVLLLLQNDSIIENLKIKDNNDDCVIWFSFEANKLTLNQNLKQLTIKLLYVHDLFILIKNLSTLEYLNVTLRGIMSNDTYNYNGIQSQSATLSPLLKVLIVNSLELTYSVLLLFLEGFEKSIESLTLNMLICNYIVDGEMIDTTILSKIPKLKEFNFFFRFNVNEKTNLNTDLDKLISTFRSGLYWPKHPVMCYHSQDYPRINVLSLPWILNQSNGITGGIVHHRLNITTPLQMTNIKAIFLDQTRIKIELLTFVQEKFVNIKKLIISWYTCVLEDQVIKEKSTVSLSSVTTLKYYGQSHNEGYIHFLLLTPNIRSFVATNSAINGINGCVNNNLNVHLICKQIHNLHIFTDDGDYDSRTTQATFPNARISFKDI